MRLALPLAIVVLAAALLAGCGSGEGESSGATTQAAPQANGSAAPAGASARECDGETGASAKLRATGISCAEAVHLVEEWEAAEGCAPASEASRSSCKIGEGYRCLSVVTQKGVSVSCARPGDSIAFTAKR